MTTTFSFKIKSNDVAPTEDGMQLVIKSVFMQILGKSSDGFSSQFGCNFDLPSPSPASYTPHSSVTEPMMIKWVQELYAENIAKIEESLDLDISASRAKNIIVDYPLPFA